MRRAGELGQWGEFRRYQVFTAFDFGISSAKFCTVIVIIPARQKMPCPWASLTFLTMSRRSLPQGLFEVTKREMTLNGSYRLLTR